MLALARLTTSSDLGAVLKGATFAIEAATENADLKFQDLRRPRPARRPERPILASNTSSISITEIAARLPRETPRVIGMHFMNPVPVMQLVEIIRGLATSDETATRTMALASALGKTPVEAQDYPGFIAGPDPPSDDQQGGLLPYGRRRHRGGASTR